jgi:hypothetical protein
VARHRSFTFQLYRAGRVSDNISAIASGDLLRFNRRARNATVVRALDHGEFWRGLWK